MREITSYQAFDGKIFDNKEECAKYEKQHFAYRVELSTMVKFLDSNRNELRNPASTDCYYEQNLENAYNCATFLVIEDDLTDDTINALHENFGIYMPCQRGEYRYDGREGWIKISNDFLNFCKQWGLTAREMIKKLTIP